MSEWYYARIHFNAELTPSNVRKLLETLQQAVQENWSSLADDLSDPTPEYGVDTETVIRQCTADNMEYYRDPSYKGYQGYWSSGVYQLSYSPRSYRLVDWGIKKLAENHFVFSIGLISRALGEGLGDREQIRMQIQWANEQGIDPNKVFMEEVAPDYNEPAGEAWWDRFDELGQLGSAWPQNKQALWHIINRLSEALPVREIEVDDQLK